MESDVVRKPQGFRTTPDDLNGFSTGVEYIEGVNDRPASQSPAPSAPVERLLVVEDDAGVAGGIVRGLRAAGFEVELATNGVDGAKKALEGGFGAIVLDLMLPGQSGFAVLEQLQGRTNVPILVLTAKSDLGRSAQVLRARRGRLHHQTLLDGGAARAPAHEAAHQLRVAEARRSLGQRRARPRQPHGHRRRQRRRD